MVVEEIVEELRPEEVILELRTELEPEEAWLLVELLDVEKLEVMGALVEAEVVVELLLVIEALVAEVEEVLIRELDDDDPVVV